MNHVRPYLTYENCLTFENQYLLQQIYDKDMFLGGLTG